MKEPDAPVFVIDLRPSEAGGSTRAAAPRGAAREPIARVAIVHEDGGVELHRLPPTQDLRQLDALARLIRFAHAHGVSVRLAAARYGSAFERRLLFEGRLPSWAVAWRGSDRG